ncbi:MAG: hypothetical protein F7C35_01030 [Desulfurococcales archaeon]|nr:hypothetical protein [Desulfurococcales archaeon]
MSAVVSRIESIMESLPKEGAKAAVALGIVERVKELAELASKAVNMIECLAQARGFCRESLCTPNCGGIFLTRDGGIHINKIRSNASGITINDEGVLIGVKDAKLMIRPDGTVQLQIPGLNETVDLKNVEDVYSKSHLLKYVVRKVGRSVDVIFEDLTLCARQSAVVC